MSTNKLTPEDFGKDEIKYGRINIEGFGKCGYAAFVDPQINKVVELIAKPYGGLYVKIEGKIYPPGKSMNPAYVMLWTKVAGWLGAEDFCQKHF